MDLASRRLKSDLPRYGPNAIEEKEERHFTHGSFSLLLGDP